MLAVHTVLLDAASMMSTFHFEPVRSNTTVKQNVNNSPLSMGADTGSFGASKRQPERHRLKR